MNSKIISSLVLAWTLAVSGLAVCPMNYSSESINITAFAAEAEAGRYSVTMKLMQFHSDEVSMGNASMNSTAHITVNSDGIANLEIDMHSMVYLDREGYLGWMKKVTAITKENKFHYPTEYETVDVNAKEEYVGVYDDFNKSGSEYTDSNVVGKWYPKVLSLPIDFENREDEILVQVYVPVMESIMAGGGTKFAVIDLDWDTLKKEGSSEPITTTTTSDNAATPTTTSASTTTTTTATTTVTTTATQPVTPSKYDKDNLEDGKYELQAEMIKVDRADYSMSNNGINHTIQLEVKNGEYFVTMQFKGLAMYNQFGYLKDLYYYNKGYTYNPFGKPMGDVTKAEVISYYDTVDQYNDANNLYPQLVRFPLVDKASEEYVPLQVFVPIMEAIADGTGTQSVLMKLDWNTFVKTDEDFKIEEQEEQSRAYDYTDSSTGVKLHADQGVLPNDTSASVTAITSGSDYETAKSNLSNFMVYSISVSADLNGKMQVSLPIPSGVSTPTVYRIADGKKTKINGTAENGLFTFSVKETGTFAIGAKPDGTTGNKNNGNTSKSSSPQTGDAGAGLGIAGLSAAIAAAFASRRKRK